MIHVSPYEIDQYQTFVYRLRGSLSYLSKQYLDELLFIPCLNLNNYLYNWNKSWLNSEFFSNKFHKLNKVISNKIKVEENIINNHNREIQGALSYKAKFIEKYKFIAKSFIWFDCDLCFPFDLLITLIHGYENVKLINDKFIITPEIIKLWDNTWDPLVNENFIHRAPSHESYYNFDPYELEKIENILPELHENTGYTKFASGWGNLLSVNIFDEISLDGLGHYGVDDTFIMFAIDKLKKQGKDYKQYILRNIVVTENNLYKEDFYNNVIEKQYGCKLKEELRKESEINMVTKLKNL